MWSWVCFHAYNVWLSLVHTPRYLYQQHGRLYVQERLLWARRYNLSCSDQSEWHMTSLSNTLSFSCEPFVAHIPFSSCTLLNLTTFSSRGTQYCINEYVCHASDVRNCWLFWVVAGLPACPAQTLQGNKPHWLVLLLTWWHRLQNYPYLWNSLSVHHKCVYGNGSCMCVCVCVFVVCACIHVVWWVWCA